MIIGNPIDETLKEQTVVTKQSIITTTTEIDLTPQIKSVDHNASEVVLPHLEGTLVYTTFFNQVTDIDTITDSSSQDVSGVYDQYLKINKCPIYLDGELTIETNPETQQTTGSGAGAIGGIITPYVGDMFTLEIDFNVNALLQITRIVPLSIITDKAFSIEFNMIEIGDGPILTDTLNKVVKTLTYIRENATIGKSYLLTDSMVINRIEIGRTILDLESEYNSNHYDEDKAIYYFETADGGIAIDSAVTAFCEMIMVDIKDFTLYSAYRKYTTTVFDALIHGSLRKLQTGLTKSEFLFTSGHATNPRLTPSLCSPVRYAMIQKETASKILPLPPAASQFIDTIGTSELPTMLLTDIMEPPVNLDYSIVPNVIGNTTYIFSESFYGTGTPTNKLEQMVLKYFNKQPLEFVDLMEIVNFLPNLSLVERFYLTPIVIYLLRKAEV